MKIIRANIQHISQIAPLFDAYRIFYGQPSDLEKAKKFLTERFQNNESVIFLALDTNDKAVGFTQLYPSFSSVTAERLYILNDLYVVPETRGTGIGKAILEHAQAFAIKQNMKGLSLSTASNNPAQKLYEKLGWEKDTEFLHYFWKA